MAYLINDSARKKKNKKKNPFTKLLPYVLIAIALIGVGALALTLLQGNSSENSENLLPTSESIAFAGTVTSPPDVMATNIVRLTQTAEFMGIQPPTVQVIASSTPLPQATPMVILPPTVVHTLTSPTQQISVEDPIPVVQVSRLSQCAGSTTTDFILLDAANQRTSDAENFQYDINLTFDLSSGVERGTISFTGRGKYIGDINNLGFEFNGSGLIDVEGQGGDFNIHFIMVDNAVYLKLDVPSQQVMVDWHRITFEDLLNSSGIPIAGLIDDTENFLSIPDDARDELQDVLLLLDIDNFTRKTRNVDNNASITTYCFDVNLIGFLTSPQFAQGFAIMLSLIGGEIIDGQTLNTNDLTQALQLLPFIIPDLSLVVSQDINQNTQYNDGYHLSFGIRLGEMALGVPLNIRVDSVIQLNSHGQTTDIIRPANAITVRSLEELTAIQTP